MTESIHLCDEECSDPTHPRDGGEYAESELRMWPVHIVVLQFPRDPDTDDPINWDWERLLDQPGAEFVTGGVMGHIRESDLEDYLQPDPMDVVMQRALAAFPDAIVEEGADGEIVVSTGLKLKQGGQLVRAEDDED